MAAQPEWNAPALVDLQRVSVEELDPILQEESRAWARHLLWDFEPSAELVRKFVRIRALQGLCLAVDGELAGYAYYVCEEHKGLIGDLYLVDRHARPDHERQLLAGVLDRLMRLPHLQRIESQLMMLRSAPDASLPQSLFADAFPRRFMMVDLQRIHQLAPATRGMAFEPYQHERRRDEVAHLIANAYYGHVDSQINDQYRSSMGARRFLQNIVEYPGCGRFFAPASLLALDPATNRACGVVLSSLVAHDIGHITQICVSSSMQRRHIGYELLRRALIALAQHGCRHASLTVTASNSHAIRLYEQVGFRARRQFHAIVWDDFASLR